MGCQSQVPGAWESPSPPAHSPILWVCRCCSTSPSVGLAPRHLIATRRSVVFILPLCCLSYKEKHSLYSANSPGGESVSFGHHPPILSPHWPWPCVYRLQRGHPRSEQGWTPSGPRAPCKQIGCGAEAAHNPAVQPSSTEAARWKPSTWFITLPVQSEFDKQSLHTS